MSEEYVDVSEEEFELVEEQAQLTAVAHERLAYGRCAARAEAVAAEAFIANRSEIANAQRALGAEFRKWEREASDKQGAILRKLHPEIYK